MNLTLDFEEDIFLRHCLSVANGYLFSKLKSLFKFKEYDCEHAGNFEKKRIEKKIEIGKADVVRNLLINPEFPVNKIAILTGVSEDTVMISAEN